MLDSSRRELQSNIAVLFEAVDELRYNRVCDGIYKPTVDNRRAAVRALAQVRDDVPLHATMVLLTALTPAVDDETRVVQWRTCCELSGEILLGVDLREALAVLVPG